jgi:hypothetical protein
VSTASSQTEYFSFNGWDGGSYQFTLRVDVRDAQNRSASATMLVTAYNSGGGGEFDPSVGEFTVEPIPTEFSLSQNYPNPFNPDTEVIFGIPEPSQVKVTIYDLLGKEVITLHDGELDPRYYSKRWSGNDAAGAKVGSGIYFCRIYAKGVSGQEFGRVMKMLLIK